jgi:hypothetical protein
MVPEVPAMLDHVGSMPGLSDEIAAFNRRV